MGDNKALLILKDGTIIHGQGFGAKTNRVGELVFNTSMIGYQEALTDPSYAGQILMLTYPLIGNYGINEKDFESSKVQVQGFCVAQDCDLPFHKESVKTVDSFLKEADVPGISNIDTRFLVRKIRNYGVTPAVIANYGEVMDEKTLLDELAFNYSGINFVEKVSTKSEKTYGTGKKKVVLIDYGVKMGIIRELVERGITVVVLPCFANVEDVMKHEPDGIMLSNGPGDPAILTDAHKTIRKLADKDYPIFGICLGHQLICHAFGGTTYKLKFGHRGSNHPVLDNLLKKVCITTQNHGFAADKGALPKELEVTHVNLNDNTVEGVRHTTKEIFSVQYHPEANPGPHDSKYLFDQFVEML